MLTKVKVFNVLGNSLILTLFGVFSVTRIQQASAKLRNVFVKALLWC